MKKPKDSLIFVRVSEEFKQKVKDRAKEKCRSMSSYILFLIKKDMID